MARLLNPEAFGLLAMVMVLFNFMANFMDLGLSTATIQKTDINHNQVSTLFWINIVAGISIFILAVVCSYPLGWFYNEPRIILIAQIFAIGILFSGLTIQHRALLSRQMRFGALAAIDLFSTVLGCIAGITLALVGTGYWALVARSLVISAVAAIGVWICCRWRPGRPIRGVGIRSMLSFGGHLTVFSLFNYFARNLDNALIGWRWGAIPLGLYSRAYAMLMFPMQQVNAPLSAVALPTLSRLQKDPDNFRKYYLKAITLIALITMPGILWMTVMADDLVPLLLGKQWLGCVNIFKILGLAALIQPILYTNGWLHVSMNRTDRMMKWGIFASALTVVAFFVGLPYGPEGVALAYMALCYLLSPVCLGYAASPTPVSMGDIRRSLTPVVMGSCIAGALLYWLQHNLFNSIPILWGLLIGLVLEYGSALSVTCLSARGLGPLRELLGFLSFLKPQRHSA
jgi:O-antigen/teichoic acid export membrane protein